VRMLNAEFPSLTAFQVYWLAQLVAHSSLRGQAFRRLARQLKELEEGKH